MEFLNNHFREIAVLIIILMCIYTLKTQDRNQKKKIKYLREIIILCLDFLFGGW